MVLGEWMHQPRGRFLRVAGPGASRGVANALRMAFLIRNASCKTV